MAWYDLEEEEKPTTEVGIPVSKLVPRVAGEQGVPVSRLKAQGQFLNAPPPRTFGEEFSTGLDRGTDQLRGLGYGLVGLMSNALGVKAGADWGYDNYRQAMEEAASKQATVTDPFEEIESFSDAGRYAVGIIGEQIPQLITSIAGGGVGGFVGKTLAKRIVANEVLKRVAAGTTATAAEREVAEAVTKNLLTRAAAAKVAEEGAERVGLAGAGAAAQAAQAGVTQGTRYGAVAGTYLANFGQISGGTYGQIRDETGEGGPAAVAAALGTSAGGAALDTLSELFIVSRIPSVGRFLGTRGVEGKPLNVNFAGRAALGAAKGVAVGAPLEGVVEYGQTAGEQAAVGLADPNQTVGERLTAPGAERERRIAAAAGFTVGGFFGGSFGTLEALEAVAPRTKQRLDELGNADDRFEQEQQEQFADGPLTLAGNWSDEVDVDGIKMRFNPNINRWAALNPPEVEGLGPAVATELSNAAVALVNPETRKGAILMARAERALSRLQGEADTVLEEETPAPADETETDDGTELVPVETMPRAPGRQGMGGARPPTFAEATQPGTTIEFRGSRGVVQAVEPDGSLRVDFGRTQTQTTFTEANENLSPGNQPLPRAIGTKEAPVFESVTPDRFNEVRVVSAEQLAREQETEAEIRRLEQELQDQSLAEEERAAKTQAMVQARQRLLPGAVAGTAFQEGPTGFTMGASEPIAVFNRRKAESIEERRRNEARTQEELQKAFDGAAVGGMRPGDKVSVALGGELVPATFAARNVNGKIRLTLDETKEEIELRPDQFQNVGFRVESPTELSDEADYNKRLRNVKSVEELAQLTGGFLPAGAPHQIKVTAPGGDRQLTYRVRYLFQTQKKGKPRLTGEAEPELAAATNDDRMRATPAAELGGTGSFDDTLQREVARGLAEGAAAAQGQTVGVAGESGVTIGGVPYAMIGDAQGFNEIWGRGPTGQLVMKRPLFAKFDLIVEPPPARPGADYDQIYQRKLAEVREKSPPVFGLSAQELTALEAQQQEQARAAANGQLRMERNNFDESYRRLKRDILRSMDTGHVVTITPETVEQMDGRMGYDELLSTLQADQDVNVALRVPLDPRGRPTGEAVPTVVSMVWRGSDGKQAPYVVTQGSKRTKNGLAQNPIDIEYEQATDPMLPEQREQQRGLQAAERESEARLLETQANERAGLQIKIRDARQKVLEAQNKAAAEQARQEQRRALEAEINELKGVLAQSTKQPVDNAQSRALTERRQQLIEENERAVKTNERFRKQIRENEAEIKKKFDAAKKEGNSSGYRSRMLNERDRLTEQQSVLRTRLNESENARRRRQAELRRLETQIKETSAQEKEAATQRRKAVQNEQRRIKTTLANRERALANFVIDEAPLKEVEAARKGLTELKSEPLENKHAKQRVDLARKQKSYRPAVFDKLSGLGSFAKIYQTDPERQLASERQRLSAQMVETTRTQENQEALQNMSEADRALVEEIIGLMNTVFPGADFYANRDRVLSLIGRGLSQPLGETEYDQVLGTAQNLAYNSAVSNFVRVLNERRARGGAPMQTDPAEQTRLTKLFVSELNAVIRERLAKQTRKASPSEQRLSALFDPTEGALALGVAAEDIQRVFDANPEQALEIIDELRRKPTRDVAVSNAEIKAAEKEIKELEQQLDPESTALIEARERLADLKANARRGQVDSKGLRPLWTKLHAIVESKTESLTAGKPGQKARSRAARATGAIKKQDLTEAKKRAQKKLGAKDKNQSDREARLFDNMVSVLGDFYAKFNPLNTASMAVDAARKRLERERGNLLRTEQFGRPEAADPDAVIDQQALIDEAKTDPETKLLGSGAGTTPSMVLVREDYGYLRSLPLEELALIYKAAGLAYSAQKLRLWYDDPTGTRLRQFEEALADLNAIDTGLTPEQEAIVEKHFARLRDIPNLPVKETTTNETEIELRTTPPGVTDPGTAGLRPSEDAPTRAANNRLRFAVAPSAVSGTGLDLSGLGDRELLKLGAVSDSLGGQLGFDAEGGIPSAGRADAEGSGSVPRPADGPAPRPRVRQPLSATDIRELTASATRFYVDAFTRKDLKNLSDDEIYRIYTAIQTEAKGAETTLAAGGNIVAQTPQPIADLISSQSGLDLLTGMAEEARAQQMNRERVASLRKNIGALAEARAFENPTKFFETVANNPSLPQNLRILAKELLRLDGRVDWNENVAAQIATFGRNFTNQPVTQKEIDRRIKTETKDGKSVFSFTLGGKKNELPVPSRRADALELREQIAEAVRRDIAISKAVFWAGRAVNIGRESAFSVYLNLNAVHEREGGAVATLLHEFEHVLLAAKLDGSLALNPVEKAALERIEAMRREAVMAEGKRRGLTGDFDQVNAQLVEISGAEANQTLRALTATQEFIVEATGNPEVFKLLADLGFGQTDAQDRPVFKGALSELWDSVATLESGVKVEANSPLGRAFTDSYLLTYSSLGDPDKEYDLGFRGITVPKFTAPQIIKNSLVNELSAAVEQERFIREQLEARDLAGTSADRNALAKEFSAIRAEEAKQEAAREARGRQPTRPPRANLPDFPAAPAAAPAPESKPVEPPKNVMAVLTGNRAEDDVMTEEEAREEQTNEEKRRDNLARMALGTSEQDFVAAFNAARNNPDIVLPEVDPVTFYYTTRANAARQLGFTARGLDVTAEERRAVETSDGVEREIGQLIAQTPPENAARRTELGEALRAVQIQGIRRRARGSMFTAKELEGFVAAAEQRGNTELAAQLRADLEIAKESEAAVAAADKAAEKRRAREQKKAAKASAVDDRGPVIAKKFGIIPVAKSPKTAPKAKQEEAPKAKQAPTAEEIDADVEAAVAGLEWGAWRQIQTGDGPKWARDAKIPKDAPFWKDYQKNKEMRRGRGLVPTGNKKDGWWLTQFSAPAGSPDPNPEVNPDDRSEFSTAAAEIDELLEKEIANAEYLSLGGALSRVFRDEVISTGKGTFVRKKLFSALEPLMDPRAVDLFLGSKFAINADANRADDLLRILARQMRETPVDPRRVTTALGSLENPLTDAQAEEIRRVGLTNPEDAADLRSKYLRRNREAFREVQRRALASLPREMRATVAEMNGHLESLQRALQKIGIVNGDLKLAVEENLGIYLNRSYAIFDNPKWVERIRQNTKVLGDAKRFLKQQLVTAEAERLRDQAAKDGTALPLEDARRMAASSVSAQQVETALNRLMSVAKSPTLEILSGRIPGQKNLSILKGRGQIAPEIQKLWGVYDDPETSYGKTVLKLSSLINNHLFLGELRQLGLDQGWFAAGPKMEKDGDEFVVVDGSGEDLFRSEDMEAARSYKDRLDFEPPPGFVKIAAEGNDKLKPLDGVYGMSEIVEGLYRMFPPADRDKLPWVLQKASWATGMTMMMATVGSVMSQVRNYGSGWFKYLSTGNFDPAAIKLSHNLAFREQFKKYAGLNREQIRGEIEDLVRRGIFGESVTVNMIRDLVDDFKNLGMAAQQGATAFEKRFDTLLRQPMKQVWDFAQGTYSMGDNVFRGMVYFSEIENYRKAYPKWSDEQLKDNAAQIARDIFWTYSMAPRWVQDLKRGPGLVIAPFITFTTEVVRTAANTLLLARREIKSGNPELVKLGWRRVGGMTAATLLPSVVGGAIMSMAGMTSDDEEDLRKFLPEWQRNNQLILFGKQGNKISFVDMSYLDPHEYFKKPVKAFMRAIGNAEDWQEAIVNGSVEMVKELLNPFTSEQLLAGAVMDVSRNIDATGKRIYNPQDTTTNIANAIGTHLASVFVPGTGRSLNRVRLGLTGEVSESGRAYDPLQEITAMLAGQRVNEIDLSQSLGFKAAEFNRAKRDATSLFNRVALTSGSVDSGEVADAYARANMAHFRLATGLRQAYRAARRLGLSESAAAERLRALGISRDDIESIKTGIYKPFTPSKDARLELERRGERARLAEIDRAFRLSQTEQMGEQAGSLD